MRDATVDLPLSSLKLTYAGQDVKIFSAHPLARPEDLLDGNVCADDEELLGDLCYKKCSLLTHGEARDGGAL